MPALQSLFLGSGMGLSCSSAMSFLPPRSQGHGCFSSTGFERSLDYSVIMDSRSFLQVGSSSASDALPFVTAYGNSSTWSSVSSPSTRVKDWPHAFAFRNPNGSGNMNVSTGFWLQESEPALTVMDRRPQSRTVGTVIKGGLATRNLSLHRGCPPGFCHPTVIFNGAVGARHAQLSVIQMLEVIVSFLLVIVVVLFIRFISRSRQCDTEGEEGAESKESTRLGLSSESTLCPALVVPSGNELALAVPSGPCGSERLLPRERGDQMNLGIREMSGKGCPVEVELKAPCWSTGADSSPIVSLWMRTAAGERILVALCRVGRNVSRGMRSVDVFDSQDRIFGEIKEVKAEGCAPSLDAAFRSYVLISKRLGLQLLFEGHFEEHKVKVWKGQQVELLADAEQYSASFDASGHYYKLRIPQGVDVGLILCALLSIDYLEAAAIDDLHNAPT